MKLKIRVFTIDIDDYADTGRRYRFVVLDLDKAKDYPANFVCLLPANIKGEGGTNSNFVRTFKDDSVELARCLLTDLLKEEDEPDVKTEIKRRLGFLKSATGETRQTK